MPVFAVHFSRRFGILLGAVTIGYTLLLCYLLEPYSNVRIFRNEGQESENEINTKTQPEIDVQLSDVSNEINGFNSHGRNNKLGSSVNSKRLAETQINDKNTKLS